MATPEGSCPSGPTASQISGGRWLDALATNQSVRNQRRRWGKRVATWDRHNSSGMHTVASALLEEVDAGPGVRALDLGCGTGRLAIPLGERGAEVLAIDVSPAMVHHLEMQAKVRGVDSIRGVAMPIERIYLPPRSFDLVVSNYALHHLRDADKVRLVEAAFGWLRPGGRLVIADMMLGRGATTRDRAIIASKVRAMAKKGLPGYWRILKNAFRFFLRVPERPLPPEVWSRLLSNAGFVEVQTRSVVAEAGMVAGRTPAA